MGRVLGKEWKPCLRCGFVPDNIDQLIMGSICPKHPTKDIEEHWYNPKVDAEELNKQFDSLKEFLKEAAR